MALASYSDLIAEIAAWLNRTDMSSEIPTFVRLFEARMNRKLRTPDQELRSDVTLLTNVATYTIPASIRQVKAIIASVSGIQMDYSIDGTSFTISPVPDGSSNSPTVTVVGYNVLTPLDGINASSNWLFASHPDAYLFGGLTYAAAYLRDPDSFALWRAVMDDAVADVFKEAEERKAPMGPVRTMPAVWE